MQGQRYKSRQTPYFMPVANKQANEQQCRIIAHCCQASGKRCGFPAQAQALGRLKKISSSRLRNASGASPRAQQSGVGAAQPDHFAAALEKLQGTQVAACGMAGQLGSRGATGATAGDARCTASAAVQL